jgi:hypothetical protein
MKSYRIYRNGLHHTSKKARLNGGYQCLMRFGLIAELGISADKTKGVRTRKMKILFLGLFFAIFRLFLFHCEIHQPSCPVASILCSSLLIFLVLWEIERSPSWIVRGLQSSVNLHQLSSYEYNIICSERYRLGSREASLNRIAREAATFLWLSSRDSILTKPVTIFLYLVSSWFETRKLAREPPLGSPEIQPPLNIRNIRNSILPASRSSFS